jgi:hypothetical protein
MITFGAGYQSAWESWIQLYTDYTSQEGCTCDLLPILPVCRIHSLLDSKFGGMGIRTPWLQGGEFPFLVGME